MIPLLHFVILLLVRTLNMLNSIRDLNIRKERMSAFVKESLLGRVTVSLQICEICLAGKAQESLLAKNLELLILQA